MQAQFPLVTSQPMTAAIGNEFILLAQVIKDAIGILNSTDIASVQGKLNSLLSKVGDNTTANTLLKFLSDIAGNLGNPSSTAATSPSSTATVSGFLKLISSYLQNIAGMSSTCTKATISLVANTSTQVIATGSKFMWSIFNYSSNEVWLEFGGVAALNSGILIPAKTAHFDTTRFVGTIQCICASAISVEYRVFT